MSDNAYIILQEQVADELLGMTLSKFFALLDEREYHTEYGRLIDIYSGVVDDLVAERSA